MTQRKKRAAFTRRVSLQEYRKRMSVDKAKYELEFLPYTTPEFPEGSGFERKLFKTRKSAFAYIDWLREFDLVEDCKLYTLPKRNVVFAMERGEEVE